MAPSDRDLGRAFAADLDELRRLEPPAEDPERRRFIVRSVLEHPALRAASASAPRRSGRVAAPIAVLAAAAAVLIAWLTIERSQPRAASGAASPSLTLRSGSVQAGRALLRGGARIAPSTALRTLGEPADLVLRDASVLRAAPSTRLVYSADREERFRLEHGRLALQVNRRAGTRPVVVETAELDAWVVGTRFEVARDQHGASFSTTVVVDEGKVRVVARSTGEARLLAAGERVTLRAAHAVDPAARSMQHGVASAQPPATQPIAAPQLASAPSRARRDRDQIPAAPPMSMEIRRTLREGAIARARRLIARAERERAVSAVELQMLQAEADLAERRYERAKTRYLAIVTAHPGTPEAELSLFAAAQLSRGNAGVDLLQRYLARYPDGRFAKEAHRLLDTLDAPLRAD